jgi:chromosome partitioning protein
LLSETRKGGVGKTTTAVNLAVCVARRGGGRVLAVDTDPQFTMTRQLGIEVRSLGVNLVDVLAGRAGVHDALVRDVAASVDAIPASRELAGVEMTLVAEIGRERFLADALEPLRDEYAVVVIDTPPNLGLLTVNALVCAEVVIAPVSCEDEASVQGLVELRATLSKLLRLRAGAAPELLSVLTRWAPGRVMSQIIEHALSDLGLAAAARVPSRAAVGQAGAEHVPLAISAPDSAVVLAYERLAERLEGVLVR